MMQPKGIAESLPRETTQTVDDVKDFRHEPEPFPVSPSVVETDFKEFDDGSLIEMTEDPANPSRPLFAIYKDGEVRFAPRFQYREQAFVPISRARPLIGHVRLPRGVMKYESVYSR